MSTSSTAASAPNAVWAERAGTRQYIGRNSSGAEVRIGMGPGEFSPGELMKIALATCNTLSADHRLAKALGEDFEATVGCSTVKNDAEERYESFQVEIVTDLSSLDAEQRELLSQRSPAPSTATARWATPSSTALPTRRRSSTPTRTERSAPHPLNRPLSSIPPVSLR